MTDPTIGSAHPRGAEGAVPGSSGPAAGSPEDRAAHTSLGDLLGEVTKDMSTLMRQEVELAKAELKQSASKAGKGAGMFGGAGLAGFMALLFLSIAAWWALGYLIGNAWSGLVIAVIYGIVGFVLYSKGKKELEQVKGLPKTADSLKKIPDTFKKDEGTR